MEKKIQSEALKVNLEETRKIIVHVPKRYREFIDLSSSHFGIHERAEKCMTEYHHPYANHAFVVAELRTIALNDFWFYSELENSDDAFLVVVESLGGLLSSGIDAKLKETIVRTLVEFIDRLTEFPGKHKGIVEACIRLLKETLVKNRDIYICCSAFFKKHLGKAAHLDDFKNEIFRLTKDVLASISIFGGKPPELNNGTLKIKLFSIETTKRPSLISDMNILPIFKQNSRRRIPLTRWLRISLHMEISQIISGN